LKPSTGALSAIIGMLSAIDRNQCPQSIGTPVRNPRNPQLGRKGGTGVLSVDAKVLARQKVEHTIPFLMTLDESFDIGADTRTPVDDSYKVPFRFTGTIDKLTFKVGHEQVTAEDRERIQRALATTHD
jgi:hypothetical protein